MRALVVDPTLMDAGSGRGGRGRRRRSQASSSLPVEIRDVRTPVPPGPGWVLIRPALAGICGTDLALVHRDAIPNVLTAYGGAGTFIPGHEVVGVVERAASTRWAHEGDRVLVEPTLRCAHKGLAECRRCRSGETHLCENADRGGSLCAGRSVGSSERAGGGWSDGFLVHEDMLVPADGISDQRGVLAEPASTALHAVLRWTRRGDTAVVIGSGTLSRLIVATLRRLHPDLDIIVLHDARSPSRPRVGRRHRETAPLNGDPNAAFMAIRSIGANRVWQGSAEQLLQKTAEHMEARVMRPAGGGLPVLDGGVDVVFDCRASELSIDLAVRLLRAGGTLVLCGRSGRHEIEWSLIWARELTVRGAASYGREPDGRRTFGTIREWLSDASFPIDGVVTHRFPLDEYGAALAIANAGVAAGAVKVVFEGPAATSLRPAPASVVVHMPDDPVLLHSTAARVRGGHVKVS
jgi:L-iditol 2-dehydrogenase